MMAVCPSCGRENPDEFAFCGHCGAALVAPAPAREVRKTVTVLFADVVGSTELGEARDPEAVRAQMGQWFDQARTTIERHGGTVEKFAGDAVMAVFGVPVVHEDDALRAVRSADELRSLDLRIGVNTGPVVAGEGETLVTGDAVNVAARLEQAAQPGEVLIGIATYRLVRDAVQVEPVEPLDLRGKSAPVEAFRLLRVDPEAAGFARHLESPLIGRRRELERMRQDFERTVEERTCHLFTLLGPAGVGKSRLAAEFLAGVEATVLRGRCLPYGEGITYFPLVEVLVQLGAEPESVIGSSPAETQLAFRRLLEREASDRPLVAVFDDIQWAEPTFLDLIEHVADLSRGAPIFVLCVARPDLLDLRPTWAGGKLNATTVLLEPLAAEECEQLIAALGGAEDETSAKIVAASEGNPLFVEEMLAMLHDEGDVAVPPTIHALLQARLDTLGRDERAVIERGAVEGQVFHRGAVVALAPETDVDVQLPSLVRKELIRPDAPTFSDEDAYRFRHLLIRDAAYESLPKETRAELHERFADWLDGHAELVEQDEIVGYHLEQAAAYRKELGGADESLERRAAERLATAGRAARDRGDGAAVITLLRRAADLLPSADQARLEAILDLAHPLAMAGRFDEARDTIGEVAASGDERLQARAVALEILLSLLAGGEAELEPARERLRAAIDSLTRYVDHEGLAYAGWVAGNLEWLACQALGSRREDEAALAHAERAGAHWLETLLLAELPGTYTHGPTALSEAERELDRLRRRREARPLLSAAISRSLGRCAALRGDFGRAKELMQAGIEPLEELGVHVHAVSSSGLGLGDLFWLEGDYPAAERLFREAYERLSALGERAFASTLALWLADAVLRQGRDDEAAAFLQQTRRLTSPGDLVNIFGADVIEALLLARSGQGARALELGRRALGRALETDFYDLRMWIGATFAEVLELCDRDADAVDLWRQVLAESEAKECVVYAERARARLERLGVAEL